MLEYVSLPLGRASSLVGLCGLSGWSPASSAGTFSQLAGVLAGFVFTAIVLVLGRRRNSADIRTLTLFLAGFVTLGFASYLYGLVSGESVSGACGRADSVTMIADGELGLGVALIAAGISWLLAGYVSRGIIDDASLEVSSRDAWWIKFLDPSEIEQGNLDSALLGFIARKVALGIFLTMATMMSINFSGYLDLIDPNVSVWLRVSLGVVDGFVVLTLVARFVLWRHEIRRPGSRPIVRRQPSGTIIFCVLLSVIYGALGGVVTVLFVGMPILDWSPIPVWASIVTVVLAIGFPIPILVGLVFGVPHSSIASKIMTAGTVEERTLPEAGG